ncbi:hypothetical protein OQA88_12603 [Cercophora sp. LCS_1]
MASTIVGKSGRVYVQGEVLQRRQDPKLSIFKAENDSFVLKRVPRPFFELSQRLATEFAGSHRLRMHLDSNREEDILIYPYFKDTLLALIKGDAADLSLAGRKKILRCVGEAIQELHSKNWIHIDVKPDNILVNWSCDEPGNKKIGHVALGDFDIAYQSEHGEPRQTRHAIGNAMWRSPEGQTGRGVTKASDVFSFGLVCIYTFGGGDLLILSGDEYQELARRGISPEQEMLTRHFSSFGPATEGLLQQVGSAAWCDALKEASAMAELAAKEEPERRFEHWGKDLGPAMQDIISKMTNPDPTARMTIDQVMMHPWWQEATE